ncbi:protein kinase domain containing protein, partial [Entamoeba invadens IP1]
TTKMTTRIDYHELEEEKKLGEGSFGIVYKGMYRGNVVAIKKMKQMSESDTAQMLKEFEKEVDMLDKFRSDYIVHFYGAVFVPKKICMVTELAPYGSLNDLMKHKKSENITKKMRVKFMMDASKGILYLHENGILHRDIKPDNILIVSLDFNTKVFGKLTDFGSSRNINLLTTNMTFTKGIGTPVYMAPEVLQQERYTKSADVYSLGITMFEAFTWQEAYPKEQFRFPWKIAEYVTHGKHPRKRSSITKEEYDLIQDCWTFRKEKRIKCESENVVLSFLVNENRKLSGSCSKYKKIVVSVYFFKFFSIFFKFFQFLPNSRYFKQLFVYKLMKRTTILIWNCRIIFVFFFFLTNQIKAINRIQKRKIIKKLIIILVKTGQNKNKGFILSVNELKNNDLIVKLKNITWYY